MNMKELLKLQAKREDLRLQAMEILDKVHKEERALSEDEQKSIDDFETKINEWDKTIKAAQKVLSVAKSDTTSNGADDTTLETAPQENDSSRVHIPFVKEIEQDKKFRNFGEMLMAVYRSAEPGARIDTRLTTRAANGLNETNPSDGGFLVQKDFSTELLKKTYETGLLASKVRKIPISTNANGIKINAIDDDSRSNGCRWGGVQTYWANEADQFVGSKPKFRQIEMTLKKLTGLCYATDELLTDSSALESVITQAFAEEFGFKIDDAIVNGNGTGQPLGILNSKAMVTQNIETGQTEKIVVENLVKMWARLWGRSRASSVWYVNQELEPLLYLLKVGDKPVYIPAGGLSDTPYATLFGRPVVPLEQCSGVGEVGDIILADLSQYLLIDKGGINATSSIHVRFLYDENVFRFIYRVDGQPIWSKPITPYRGANTLSPFVTLAKR